MSSAQPEGKENDSILLSLQTTHQQSTSGLPFNVHEKPTISTWSHVDELQYGQQHFQVNNKGSHWSYAC
jgi:hypothetical protein